jgi:hypothetical protein
MPQGKRSHAKVCSDACKSKAKRRRLDPLVGSPQRYWNQRDALDMLRLDENDPGWRHEIPGYEAPVRRDPIEQLEAALDGAGQGLDPKRGRRPNPEYGPCGPVDHTPSYEPPSADPDAWVQPAHEHRQPGISPSAPRRFVIVEVCDEHGSRFVGRPASAADARVWHELSFDQERTPRPELDGCDDSSCPKCYPVVKIHGEYTPREVRPRELAQRMTAADVERYHALAPQLDEALVRLLDHSISHAQIRRHQQESDVTQYEHQQLLDRVTRIESQHKTILAQTREILVRLGDDAAVAAEVESFLDSIAARDECGVRVFAG